MTIAPKQGAKVAMQERRDAVRSHAERGTEVHHHFFDAIAPTSPYTLLRQQTNLSGVRA